MQIIKNILNSNLINKTLLKNCQYYKVRRYNSKTIHNLTFTELQAFKQKNDIVYYYITKPSAQKAAKVQNTLLNTLSLICFTTALILTITF
mgnify:FL=1